MSSTVFLGNLPTWVTADDVKQWLVSDNLVADSVKVIRNPETQESKGFAFIEAPNDEEMNLIIRRFDRAPLEERLLRANPAQPPRPKGAAVRPSGAAPASAGASASAGLVSVGTSAGAPVMGDRNRRGGKKHRKASNGPQSAFAEELAKAL